MEEATTMDFSEILKFMKQGHYATRNGWNNPSIKVFVQVPDEHSKMTKPYLVMKKGDDMFPLDLSCESIFAEDWYITQK